MKCSWAPKKEPATSRVWVPTSEARSNKIPGKGKGKEKVVVGPKVEEEEEEVESEKGDAEESPQVHAQWRWVEWLDPDKLSVTKYVNGDKWLKELFMTFAMGMAEEHGKWWRECQRCWGRWWM